MLHLLFQFANKLSIGVVFITLLGLFVACNPQPEAPLLLERAEALMDTKPDSAMLLIDSIFYPEKSLKQQRYMDYLVAKVQARNKNYLDITGDTLIFTARDYYLKRDKTGSRQSALACFYSGWVYRELKDYDTAMYWYKEAEKQSQLLIGDSLLHGLVAYNMGDLLLQQSHYSVALPHYHNAVIYYNSNPVQKTHTLAAIGRLYLYEEKYDSAFNYFKKALTLAGTTNDKELESLLLQNMSVAYRENKQFDKAEQYLRKSFNPNEDNDGQLRYHLNLAKIFQAERNADSLKHYVEKIFLNTEEVKNNNLKASVFHFLSSVEKDNKHFEEALDYQQKYSDIVILITQERMQSSAYEIQQKYNFQSAQNDANKKLQRRNLFIASMILLILFGALSFTFYTIKQRNRYIEAQQHIATLRDLAEDAQKLKNDYHAIAEAEIIAKVKAETKAKEKGKEIIEVEKKAQQLMLWKFDIAKKLALLNQSVHENKNQSLSNKIFRVIHGEGAGNQWDALTGVFREVNPKMMQELQQYENMLSVTDYRVLLLSSAKFKPDEISALLNLSYNTVLNKRSLIRKKIAKENANLFFE